MEVWAPWVGKTHLAHVGCTAVLLSSTGRAECRLSSPPWTVCQTETWLKSVRPSNQDTGDSWQDSQTAHGFSSALASPWICQSHLVTSHLPSKLPLHSCDYSGPANSFKNCVRGMPSQGKTEMLTAVRFLHWKMLPMKLRHCHETA